MVKTGVIGVGVMGKNHARVYSEISEFVGAYDLNSSLVDPISDKFHSKSFNSIEDLLSEVDAISVATPTTTHFDICSMALNAGVNVLVEKPITRSIDEAKQLCDLAETNDLTFAVGHIERYNPVIGYVKNKIMSGEYGNIISLSSKRVSSFPQRINDVGVIFDLGIHELDILRYLANSEVKSIYAHSGNNNGLDNEDYANISLLFENGIFGTIETNWLTPMKVRKLSLTGSKKFVELDYASQKIFESTGNLSNYDEGNLSKDPWTYQTIENQLNYSEPLKNELQNFLFAIENNKKPLVSGNDGLESLKLAELSVKSAMNEELIKL